MDRERGKDDNCNGATDEENALGCAKWYYDGDRDAWGVATNFKCLCAKVTTSKYDASQTGDCNDADAAIHPGATESCNGKDDDCDGPVDEDTASLCDDLNACTDDACGGSAGCTHAPRVGATCDDGNAETYNDRCDGLGACAGKTIVLVPPMNSASQDGYTLQLSATEVNGSG